MGEKSNLFKIKVLTLFFCAELFAGLGIKGFELKNHEILINVEKMYQGNRQSSVGIRLSSTGQVLVQKDFLRNELRQLSFLRGIILLDDQSFLAGEYNWDEKGGIPCILKLDYSWKVLDRKCAPINNYSIYGLILSGKDQIIAFGDVSLSKVNSDYTFEQIKHFNTEIVNLKRNPIGGFSVFASDSAENMYQLFLYDDQENLIKKIDETGNDRIYTPNGNMFISVRTIKWDEKIIHYDASTENVTPVYSISKEELFDQLIVSNSERYFYLLTQMKNDRNTVKLRKIKKNGQVDTSFGSNGILSYQYSFPEPLIKCKTDEGNSTSFIDSNFNIVILDFCMSKYGHVMRVNEKGQWDTSFGKNGVVQLIMNN